MIIKHTTNKQEATMHSLPTQYTESQSTLMAEKQPLVTNQSLDIEYEREIYRVRMQIICRVQHIAFTLLV